MIILNIIILEISQDIILRVQKAIHFNWNQKYYYSKYTDTFSIYTDDSDTGYIGDYW